MSELMGNATGQELSVIKDPFTKESVSEIMIRYTTDWSNPHWYAKVCFKNGHTSGEQKTPNCKDFDEVLAHLKQIINSVENKQP